MRTDLFDFDLPPDRIALRPASPRDAARLLVVRPGAAPECEDRVVRDLPELLRPGDAARRQRHQGDPGAASAAARIGRGPAAGIEATLIKRLDGARWQALVKPAPQARGRRSSSASATRASVCFLDELDATVEAKGEAGEVTLRLRLSRPDPR